MIAVIPSAFTGLTVIMPVISDMVSDLVIATLVRDMAIMAAADITEIGVITGIADITDHGAAHIAGSSTL
jgi:hypothetical protein